MHGSCFGLFQDFVSKEETQLEQEWVSKKFDSSKSN